MVYTESRRINKGAYYYRVISIRKENKISKKRIYLGHDLSALELSEKERKADEKLLPKNKASREIKKMRPKILRILNRYKIKHAGIFGSYARNEQKKSSDVDILVKIENRKMSLLDFIGLKLELEDALKKKVDLVDYVALKPLIKNNILKEEVRIL